MSNKNKEFQREMLNAEFEHQDIFELHKHFVDSWKSRASNAWETIKLNTALSSALTSLAIYSIIYLYTSEFFWKAEQISLNHKLCVRASLLSIPFALLIVNIMLYRNFNRQCRRLYQIASIVIKIQERMGLYRERSEKEQFKEDKGYVPKEWKNMCISTSDEFVKDCMSRKDKFYRNMVWLFWIFEGVSIFLIIIEFILLLS